MPLLIHQPVYSMLNRWVEDGLLDVLAEVGAGCIPFSPLAQGLLTDKYLKGMPADSRAAKNHSLPRNRGSRRSWSARLNSSTPSPGAAARALPSSRSSGCSATRASPRR